MHRHGAGSYGHAAGHDDGEWHGHAARNGHGCSRNDGHAHAASLRAGDPSMFVFYQCDAAVFSGVK